MAPSSLPLCVPVSHERLVGSPKPDLDLITECWSPSLAGRVPVLNTSLEIQTLLPVATSPCANFGIFHVGLVSNITFSPVVRFFILPSQMLSAYQAPTVCPPLPFASVTPADVLATLWLWGIAAWPQTRASLTIPVESQRARPPLPLLLDYAG